MKQLLTLLLMVTCSVSFAQIRGTITDDKGTPLPLVSVLVENTYNGTSSNEKGQYEINLSKTGKHTLIFQYLGFKTKKITVNIDKFPFLQNVALTEENLSLNEVVINTKENPANAIIKKAIAARKANSEQTAHFTADFYSRGIFKVKGVPKKIMGEKVDDPDGVLDSTGSGIMYLSETVSKIIFEKPNNLKERILASKISGNNQGYSYNTAMSTHYDFYDNNINMGMKMISPIADNALNYYKYKLEGTFQDENNQMINKIKVIVRRDAEPVYEGYIYIVEDSWAIYAVDLDAKGYRMHREMLDDLRLVQNFTYNKTSGIWAKTTQSIELNAQFFGIKFNGKFSHVYSNYEFFDKFDKKTFSNEIVSIDKDSNKKDSIFWQQNRPIPLTEEEHKDYIKKDSVEVVHSSKTYLDSIDRKNNKFKILAPISGYSFVNSYKRYSFTYDGLLNVSSLSYNTVQGWNLNSGFSYKKWDKEGEGSGKYTSITSVFNYGFAEDRLRVKGTYFHMFNNQNYANINVCGGTEVSQFNPENPISKLVNSVATLFFKDNYMKLYNKEFAGITYGQNVSNGISLVGKIEYQQRKPLFNNTDYVILKQNDVFSSNNPLAPDNDLLPAFSQHHLTKASIGTRFSFNTKYITRPDGKINFSDGKYPMLFLAYTNAFAATAKNYEYQLVTARITYDFTMANKGKIAMNIKGGKFFHGDDISFIDYKHFNGNQTHFSDSGNYLNTFNMLPYYSNSTNDAYSENHFEYNDNGFIMNKIPVLSLLKSNLMLGFHSLLVPDRKPYSEFTVGLSNLGFGKFKLLRVDYVRSYEGGVSHDGVVFGLTLNAFN